MATATLTFDKTAADQRLARKVAAMTVDQRGVRIQEIVNSPDFESPELSLEFAKLLLGPDATASD